MRILVGELRFYLVFPKGKSHCFGFTHSSGIVQQTILEFSPGLNENPCFPIEQTGANCRESAVQSGK
jgi:hypothetical protein